MFTPISISKDTQLGDLVTFFPDIAHTLNDNHIDYCCQGNRTLVEAVSSPTKFSN